MTDIRTIRELESADLGGAAGGTHPEVQRHLADLEAKEALEEAEARAEIARQDEHAELSKLREELRFLRGRLTTIKEQTRMAGKAHVEWLDDSAHRQLGSQPWLKLAGAMAGTFVVARMLRAVPIVTMVMPLLLQQAARKR